MANPYLAGNFAPVTEELAVEAPLPVDGAVPPVLEGMVVRNGPNPVSVADPDGYHWFGGDGMVHAIELRDGQAVSYRNRWVRTRKLAAESGTKRPPGPSEPIDGPANTHVVWHGGKLLALCESGFPHRLTTDLDTVCVDDFDGMLASAMTAHPHVDPDTGAMALFGYDVFGPPFLRYHELDRQGSLVHSTEVDVPQATMQHDFAVTGTRVAFLDLPVVFDLDRAMQGRPLPFRWQPEAGARVGVLDRGEEGTGTRWVTTDPCYVFHVMNAFDDGATVVIDVLRYDRAFDVDPPGFITPAPPTLERWRVDPVLGRLSATPLDDRGVEFPRVDDTLAGRPYRFGYGVEVSQTDDDLSFGGLVRYDLVRDEVARWDPGPGRQAGEPVFVRDPDGRADDEGWVLSVVYDATTDKSDLVILDGSSFGKDPDAVVHLPARVPFGFHGSWVPAARYR